MPKANLTGWRVVVVVAGAMLAAAGPLLVRLRPYWVAKYEGRGADLQGAVLPLAPLTRASLIGARLQRANLRGANLTEAH
jgi:hypothetical protein